MCARALTCRFNMSEVAQIGSVSPERSRSSKRDMVCSRFCFFDPERVCIERAVPSYTVQTFHVHFWAGVRVSPSFFLSLDGYDEGPDKGVSLNTTVICCCCYILHSSFFYPSPRSPKDTNSLQVTLWTDISVRP